MLTCDVSGTSGSPITYIADVTGDNTDGVGGTVRITGSDNDQSATRTACITTGANRRNYRTVRGFTFDMCTQDAVQVIDGDHWIVEDCCFAGPTQNSIELLGANQAGHIVRRCLFVMGARSGTNRAIYYNHGSDLSNTGHVVENCCFLATGIYTVHANNVGGVTVKNCLFVGCSFGVLGASMAVGQDVTVNNCIFESNGTALYGFAADQITEDYNTFYNNSTDRTNTAVGGNSLTYPALLQTPVLLDGFKFPWWFGQLSEWSQIAAIAGTGEATDDLFGIARPTTSSKKSWGLIQFNDAERSTTQAQGGSASIVLNDAGIVQFIVPVTAESTTITVYAYREADYAGTNPQMIIRQPGQSDRTTTDAAAASQWNQLSDTFTPDSDTDFVTVLLKSNNTAAAGDYKVYFDTLAVD
jgi:hypothetical protein